MGASARRQAEIAALGLLDRPPPAVVGHLLHAARLLTGADDAQLNVLVEDAQLTLVDAGGGQTSAALADSVCVRVLDGPDDDVQVVDAAEDTRYADVGSVVRGEVRGYAASRLVTSAGVVIGTVCVFSERRLELAPHLVEALHQVGLSTMAALEARRSAHEVEQALAGVRHEGALLDRTNEHLAAFAGQVAHDLQGPLATIGFALEALEDDPEDAPELVRVARSSTARLQRTVAALLEFTRLGDRSEREPVVLADLVAEVLEDLGHVRGTTAVSVDELPVVEAVPELLRGLLLNLLDNAFKYTAQVARPGVRVAGGLTAEGWWLAVDDNGPGVALADREMVFEPLVRGDSALVARSGGHGIGLATCRRVAQVHGGVLRIERAALGGARFLLQVPDRSVAAPHV